MHFSQTLNHDYINMMKNIILHVVKCCVIAALILWGQSLEAKTEVVKDEWLCCHWNLIYTPEPRIKGLDNIHALEEFYIDYTTGKQTVNQHYFGCRDLKQEPGTVQVVRSSSDVWET